MASVIPKRDEPFKPPCLSLDLEVSKEDGRIHAFGAVRGDTDATVEHRA